MDILKPNRVRVSASAVNLVPPQVEPTAAHQPAATGPARSFALRLLQRIEAGFDPFFGQACNPWRHLGGLSVFFFWIILVTGFYLFVVFDTSVQGAYSSSEYLSKEQWYLGGVMRSLHRYASDAFVVVMFLHLVREWVNGRYHSFRWFSWVTGVFLVWLVYASGITGYWLVWDELAQFVAIATAEWLDWLPIFSEPMVRNFLTPVALTDRFFTLLVYMHITIPLVLLFGMWVHIQRISRPKSNPPRMLGWGAFLAMLLLSLAKPVLSQGPAILMQIPGTMEFDWFYLFPFPLLYDWSPGKVWALIGAATLFLVALPWLRGRAVPQPVAQVSLDNCNGCGRCFNDCPYAAVTMQPRTDGRNFKLQAEVIPELCASCGICAGACPSSTPFRKAAVLRTGIDMPQLPVTDLRARLDAALEGLSGRGRMVVFGCDHAADVHALEGPGVAVFSLLCAAQLPPSFIEYALRHGAEGVLVTGCREEDCHFRLGTRWVDERVSGMREPHLRRNVPPERLRLVWAGAVGQAELARQLDEFRAELKNLAERGEIAPLQPPQPVGVNIHG